MGLSCGVKRGMACVSVYACACVWQGCLQHGGRGGHGWDSDAGGKGQAM